MSVATDVARTIAHPEERELWEAVAAAIQPRTRVRPSAFAERSIILDQSNARPGPFSCDWKPWTRDLHDLHFDHPEKLGEIGIKPEQIGASRANINRALCNCATDPGPMLYLTTDAIKAQNFAVREFMPSVRACPELDKVFSQSAEDNRSLIASRPFAGGVIDFVGAGSESGVISTARKFVVLDEYQKSSENFPKSSGDLFGTAFGRTKTFRQAGLGGMYVFSHPRYDNEDVMDLWTRISDRRRWCFDCPHCGALVFPCSARVRMTGLDESDGEHADLNPDSAVFVCATNGCVILDAERAHATWPPRLGGTGRFVSELSAEEQAKRPFIGWWVTGLADPAFGVREWAAEFVQKKTVEQRQTFFNKRNGEPDARSEGTLALESIEQCLKPMADIVVPGGPRGVRFLCAGADVQSPRHNPTFVTVGMAFAANGLAYLVWAKVVSGFAAYHALLGEASVKINDGAGNSVAGPAGLLGVRMASIDTGYETQQVMHNSRIAVYSAARGGKVEQLPLKYTTQTNADNPAILAPESKRTDIARPELGAIDYFYLHRHSWVDRAIRRIQEGRLVILCALPLMFKEHLMSNMLRPKLKLHGLEPDAAEWWKPKELRDDFLQALAYCEAGAVLKLGLDRIHAADEREARERPAAVNERDGEQRRGKREFGAGMADRADRLGQERHGRGRGGWWNV